MQKITPFIWFKDQAEEAARFYVSVFKNSKIVNVLHYSKGTHGKPGSVMTVEFKIMGQRMVALNGGPIYQITPGISFVVNCRNQREVDHYWNKLSAKGKKIQCGWLEDRFGVTWQVVPVILFKLLSSKHPKRAERVTKAMLKMKKLVIKDLQRAADAK